MKVKKVEVEGQTGSNIFPRFIKKCWACIMFGPGNMDQALCLLDMYYFFLDLDIFKPKDLLCIF